MLKIFHKSRKHPIIRDEQGRSARQQSFDLYEQGYRPSQIFEEKLIPVPMNTLLRYHEDWKKQTSEVPDSTLTEYLSGKLRLSRRDIMALADYFGVSEAQIILTTQKPLGLLSLLYSELPDNRLLRIRQEIEDRLEAALKLIYFTENFYQNSPEQINRFLGEILAIEDNTRLVISKVDGRIAIRKDKIQDPS